jgi:hypothetical protein
MIALRRNLCGEISDADLISLLYFSGMRPQNIMIAEAGTGSCRIDGGFSDSLHPSRRQLQNIFYYNFRLPARFCNSGACN